MTEGKIIIKRGREKPIRQQHPWIFSGAIDDVKDNPAPGDLVTVLDSAGHFLARGYWNPKSQIQVRILTWQDEPIDEVWWRRMLRRAMDARLDREDIHQNWDNLPARLVNAENDFIPGLVVDCYPHANVGYWLVLQALTLGIDLRKKMLANLLNDELSQYAAFRHGGLKGIYERSDVDVRGKEGLQQETGLLLGEEPPELVKMQVSEDFLVDVRKGHKTGFYLDQAANRWLLRLLVMEQHTGLEPFRILNLFSYTGTFGINAAVFENVYVTNVDASFDALELGEKMVRENNSLDPDHFEFIQADVFEFLRDQAAEGQQYDVVICDPPKFAHNAGQVEKAARGYKDINLNAFKCVKAGGYLMTFSCSGAISADLFQKIVFGALADSGRQAQILKHLGPSDDHPVALTFPEGAYLKGLLLRVY